MTDINKDRGLRGVYSRIKQRLSCHHDYQVRGILDTDGTGTKKCLVCSKCNAIKWENWYGR